MDTTEEVNLAETDASSQDILDDKPEPRSPDKTFVPDMDEESDELSEETSLSDSDKVQTEKDDALESSDESSEVLDMFQMFKHNLKSYHEYSKIEVKEKPYIYHTGIIHSQGIDTAMHLAIIPPESPTPLDMFVMRVFEFHNGLERISAGTNTDDESDSTGIYEIGKTTAIICRIIQYSINLKFEAKHKRPIRQKRSTDLGHISRGSKTATELERFASALFSIFKDANPDVKSTLEDLSDTWNIKFVCPEFLETKTKERHHVVINMFNWLEYY